MIIKVTKAIKINNNLMESIDKQEFNKKLMSIRENQHPKLI